MVLAHDLICAKAVSVEWGLRCKDANCAVCLSYFYGPSTSQSLAMKFSARVTVLQKVRISRAPDIAYTADAPLSVASFLLESFDDAVLY